MTSFTSSDKHEMQDEDKHKHLVMIIGILFYLFLVYLFIL